MTQARYKVQASEDEYYILDTAKNERLETSYALISSAQEDCERMNISSHATPMDSIIKDAEALEFTMTPEDLIRLLDAARPSVSKSLQNYKDGITTQDRVNGAWETLGMKMGFIGSTAKPHPNGDPHCFIAVRVTQTELDEAEPSHRAMQDVTPTKEG